MIQYVDECVSCPKEMGCLGTSCKNRNVPILICDECGQEVDELYEIDFDNNQRCLSCLLEVVGARKVEG